MAKYIIKRLLMMIPVVLGVTLIVFLILRLTPNDPIRTILGDLAPEEEVEAMRDAVGLNDPIYVQLFNYVKNIVTRFDFGTSWTNGKSVLSELGGKFKITCTLALYSVVFAACIGIPLGILSACHQYGLFDNISSVICFVFMAMPSFWFALLLIMLFSLQLGWLPASGSYGVKYFILPILALSTGLIAGIMRNTRSNMLEVIRQDYITTARAKGLADNAVIYRHGLRNAMIPVVTYVGMKIGDQLGGSFVIETVFALPGLGKLLVDACSVKNMPVVQGGVILIAVVFAVVNLLVDLLYTFIDPRMSSMFKSAKKGAKKNVQE